MSNLVLLMRMSMTCRSCLGLDQLILQNSSSIYQDYICQVLVLKIIILGLSRYISTYFIKDRIFLRFYQDYLGLLGSSFLFRQCKKSISIILLEEISLIFFYYFYIYFFKIYCIQEAMLSFQMQRNNRPTFISMKNAINIGQKQQKLQKLGGSIKASIQKLQRIRTDILSQSNIKKLSLLFAQYQKQNSYYNQLQKSLVQIDEKSDTLDKIINMNKRFIENNDPKELEKKINFMKNQRSKNNSESVIEMNIFNQEFQAGQVYSGKHELRRKMLDEQKLELNELQKITTQINKMMIETSNMILQQGMKLKIAATTMSRVRDNLREGRQELEQANTYQQDTNKKLISFCVLAVLVICIIIMIMYSSKKQT